MAEPVRIFISAGEASGDLYGALLIGALQERLGEVEFWGCGGDRMRAAGCRTLVDAHQIAMVGLVEVIPGLVRAWKALRRLARTIRSERPDLAILIDFPDFNLRLARKLKQAGTPVLYFVAPQVWAWRGWRVNTIRKYVDRLLCIFPFEEEFFRTRGVQADFVGHPLVGRVAPKLTPQEFRNRFGLPKDVPILALLPGSRKQEILLNLPPMLETVERLAATGHYCFVLPAASTTTETWLRSRLAGSHLSVAVVENCTYDAVAHAQTAIVASGTAATEAALLGTPMVIVYRVSSATWRLGRWLVKTPFFSMVNLVAGHQVVPEFIQDRFQPEEVAREVKQLLEAPAVRERIRQELREVTQKLHPPSKNQKVAGGSGVPQNPENEDPIQRAAAIAESILKEQGAGQRPAAPRGS